MHHDKQRLKRVRFSAALCIKYFWRAWNDSFFILSRELDEEKPGLSPNIASLLSRRICQTQDRVWRQKGLLLSLSVCLVQHRGQTKFPWREKTVLSSAYRQEDEEDSMSKNLIKQGKVLMVSNFNFAWLETLRLTEDGSKKTWSSQPHPVTSRSRHYCRSNEMQGTFLRNRVFRTESWKVA